MSIILTVWFQLKGTPQNIGNKIELLVDFGLFSAPWLSPFLAPSVSALTGTLHVSTKSHGFSQLHGL